MLHLLNTVTEKSPWWYAKANIKMVMINVPEPKEAEHDAIHSVNKGCNDRRTFTARSNAFVACGIVVLVVIVAILTVTTVMARNETSSQPVMITPQASGGSYQGNCILVNRETRLVDSYKEEAASFKNESDGNCFVSVAGKLVIHLEGNDCDTAATAQCVAYPYADWCAHAEYKPFCLPQNECTNPYEFDANLLSKKVSFEKCENGVLTFRFNGTYSNDAPLIKKVVDGKLVIDASGTVVAMNFIENQDKPISDDPNIVYGKDISLIVFTNVYCDDKKTKYVCENLIEWQDELATWLPWEYPCWIFSEELEVGQIVTISQVNELCEWMVVGS